MTIVWTDVKCEWIFNINYFFRLVLGLKFSWNLTYRQKCIFCFSWLFPDIIDQFSTNSKKMSLWQMLRTQCRMLNRKLLSGGKMSPRVQTPPFKEEHRDLTSFIGYRRKICRCTRTNWTHKMNATRPTISIVVQLPIGYTNKGR